ncbi:DUF2490 domain-containing protein [Nibrella viscosa]|uniref:DUF2490 domain-containing protein n=1 Tax=Nibrella viscosa TaxID=1084524 RepID=A0ABP8K2S5_9BACT
MKKHVLILLTLVLSTQVQAQTIPAKIVNPQQQLWVAYFNQIRFSNRWGFWLDVHARRTGDFIERWSTQIFRPGITYYLSDQVRLTAGYAYVLHYPQTDGVAVRPEHRPWQQINWSGRFGKLHTNQWIRLEERYNRRMNGNELGEGYRFNYRFRYNLTVQVPLKGDRIQPGVLNFAMQDELHVNAGRQITYNYFDQNRLFIGLAYPFTKSFLAQFGYMNVFVQQPVGNVFTNNHTIRLFLFHNLDFRQPVTPVN